MALVIDVNSYIVVVDADTYFTDRVFCDEWFALATEEIKSKYLVTAFNLLENSFIWFYNKTDSAQAQEFPRNDETSVPQKIKDAQCEITLLLIKNQADLERPDKVMKHDKITIQTDYMGRFNDVITSLLDEYGQEKTVQIVTLDIYR